MKKLLVKPIYPREPKYKEISCKVSNYTKNINKIAISIEDINHEINSVLVKYPDADNFKIKISTLGDLNLNYDIPRPISDEEREKNIEYNKKLSEKYKNALKEYHLKLDDYKSALEKELKLLNDKNTAKTNG